jgi:hypothetical protein
MNSDRFIGLEGLAREFRSVEGGRLRRQYRQALRYALIVLPYGQHRASLRPCLH